MFDQLVAARPALGKLSAGELVDAVAEWSRVANGAAAMKASLVAELFTRRTGAETARERVDWWADPETAVVVEVAAALGVTQGSAARETERAVVLRDRLPVVAALFADGLINEMTVRTIVFRTGLITDAEVLAAVDAALAGQARFFGALSAKKVEQAIDATVIAHDPAARRRAREHAAERTVGFSDPHDVPGLTSMWARLDTVDAKALQDRVETVARTVCGADPRGIDERRAAALGVIGAGLDALACQCGHGDCDAAMTEKPVRTTTVFVVVDADTAAEAGTDSYRVDEGGGTETGPAAYDRAPADARGAEAEAANGKRSPREVIAKARPRPIADAAPATSTRKRLRGFGVMPGAGVIPTALLGAVLDGARVRQVVHPGDAGPEDRYTPSAALAAFVRCRDMTCRFPFCDVPATDADIDHTVPWPLGPTHASNIKCLCRLHHLVKTFWGGPGGWRDRQLPDGIVIWTSPTEHTYIARPGSRLWFPSLCRPTGALWDGDPPEPPFVPDARRAAGMPRRRRPRTRDRARRINSERRLNATDVAAELEAEALARGHTLALGDDWIARGGPPANDPPPF